MIEIVERREFVQLPNKEVNRIAQMHAKNGFSLLATASQLGMNIKEFQKLIMTHENLRIAICQQKKLMGVYRPYGPKRGEVTYEDTTKKN